MTSTASERFSGLLQETTSQSRWIVAVFADVRGFGSFCQAVDSAEAATFVKKTCKILVDRYFPDASFLKLTGDGLLAVYEYMEGAGTEIACKLVETCLLLTKDFRYFFSNDEYMIGCGVPDKLGIGIAMGPVGCLMSHGEILDYSGRPLNLASRLMSMARPRGIVLDARIGVALQKRTDLKSKFVRQDVYAPGIAELKPISVFYSQDYTVIPRIYLQPLTDYDWVTKDITRTFAQLRRLSEAKFVWSQKKKVIDPDQATITIWRPKLLVKTTGARFFYMSSSAYRHTMVSGRHAFEIDFGPAVSTLAKDGAKDSDRIKIRVEYPSLID